MRIALCATKATPHGKMILDAVARGLMRHGDLPEWIEHESQVEAAMGRCACAVAICSANRNQSERDPVVRLRNRLDAVCRTAGRRVLTIDTGFVGNDREWAKTHPRQPITGGFDAIQLEVGFDGIKRHADYCMAIGEAPSDRWGYLGVDLHPWRSPTDIRRVLLIGQTSGGASSQDIDIEDWYGEAMRLVAGDRSRSVLYRAHPRMAAHAGRLEWNRKAVLARYGSGFDFAVSTHEDIEDDFAAVDAVAVYSSNAAVTAVLRGLPTFVGADICMAWDVAGRLRDGIDAFQPVDRLPWAHRLAWAQWTCREMAEGAMWAHFRSHAEKPRTR